MTQNVSNECSILVFSSCDSYHSLVLHRTSWILSYKDLSTWPSADQILINQRNTIVITWSLAVPKRRQVTLSVLRGSHLVLYPDLRET